MRSSYICTLLLALFLFAGCKSDDSDKADYAYVAHPQVTLRDRVAAVYNKVGTLTSGQRVQVLDRSQNRRFIKVRSEDGKEGWMEQRYLVDQEVYDGFAKLARENAGAPVQSTAIARRPVNLHVVPARNAEAIYQVKENGKVQLLRRTSTPKSGLKKQVEETNQSKEEEESAKTALDAAPDPLEDWWLVRDEQQHVGWLLGRMVDIDIPLEIAQYAEGKRIVAAFVLNEVPQTKESEKRVPQYAVLLTENKDGLPFDFNQVRIFTWNPSKTRYETAYRERTEGKLPFKVSKEDFGREGVLPTFTMLAVAKDGSISERKYKLIGPIVRRVITASAEKPQQHRPEQRKSGK